MNSTFWGKCHGVLVRDKDGNVIDRRFKPRQFGCGRENKGTPKPAKHPQSPAALMSARMKKEHQAIGIPQHRFDWRNRRVG